MQTFTQALIDHVLSGKVDKEVAANAATNRHDFLVTLEQAIKRQAGRRPQAEAERVAVAEPQPEAADAAIPAVVAEPEESSSGLRIIPAG